MSYLIPFTISSVLFYAVYILIFNKDTFFDLRRVYLIGSILFACVIPSIIQSDVFRIVDVNFLYFLPSIEVFSDTDMLMSTNQDNKFSFYDYLYIIYYVGAIAMLIKLVWSSAQLMSIIGRGEIYRNSSYSTIEIKGWQSPFSFFRYIVIDSDLYSPLELDRIMLHEMEHVKRNHSIDIILIELLGIVFWFHPIIYLFKNQIKINHEYQADEKVLSRYSRKQYGHILLRQSESGKRIVFANYFFHSFIKKRIMMMYIKRSNKNYKYKYLLVIPMLLGLVFSLSNCSSFDTNEIGYVRRDVNSDEPPIPPIPPSPPSPTSDIDEVYKVVDEMPRFPGCEDMSIDERNHCAQTKMLSYIYTHVKYPQVAKSNGTEGTVVIEFVVGKEGQIGDVVILRPLGDSCDVVAMNAIKAMNNDLRWIPGKQNGRNVAVKYTMPIKFKLEGKK